MRTAPAPRRAFPAADATRHAASDPKLASRTLEAFPAHALMIPSIAAPQEENVIASGSGSALGQGMTRESVRRAPSPASGGASLQALGDPELDQRLAGYAQVAGGFA